jgi:hypothetical protein
MSAQGNKDSRADAARSALDHRAVSAVGELLMSGIWLEHRVRSIPKLLGALPSPRISVMSRVRSSSDLHSDSGTLRQEDPPNTRRSDRPDQARISCQLAGTRPAGPGTGWSMGWCSGGAR